MSDLRTRLIKLLTDAELATQRFLDTDGYYSTRVRSNETAATIAADAVIRELDMRQEVQVRWLDIKHRYVTKWET